MQPYENLALARKVVSAILPGREGLRVARVREGGSTVVFRVGVGAELYYLRVLPEAGASFRPEAYVHSALRAWGLRAPEVVYFEDYNPLLERSVMLTAAVAGRAIGGGARPAGVAQIVREAGRELARLNSLPVQGFGWVVRSGEWGAGLAGEYRTCEEWLREHFEGPLESLSRSGLLSARERRAIRAALAEAGAMFGAEPAGLAHGDFDGTHIFYQEGRYTGIIDFGEIRGAHRLYDLGHFWVEYSDLLPALLEGYRQAAALPADYLRQIHLNGLLIAARRLGRRLAGGRGVYGPDLEAVRRGVSDFGFYLP